ncbi:hypothetical protein I308_105243 [Cryptococcus tetragattii IND107]|uniref:Uncharacterized protein n=1 Tax=Cryptococcus tetragattii IND107 TaxID=1296105 RepID=A0ABR3BMG9_9TREE
MPCLATPPKLVERIQSQIRRRKFRLFGRRPSSHIRSTSYCNATPWISVFDVQIVGIWGDLVCLILSSQSRINSHQRKLKEAISDLTKLGSESDERAGKVVKPYSVLCQVSLFHSSLSVQASGPSSESSLLAVSTSSPLKLLSIFRDFP